MAQKDTALETIKRVLMNLSYLFFSMVIVQVFSFITTVYIARALGPEPYGRLNFIFTIVTYFSLISFSGVPILGIRKIAKSKSQAEIKQNIMNITVLRALLAFTALIALSLFTITINKSIETKYIMFLYGLSMLVTGMALNWVFQGIEKMQFSELSGILYAVLYAAFIYLFVREPDHILLVPYLALPINIFTLALSLVFLLRFFGNIKFFIDLKALKENFLTSLPLSLLPILFYMSRNIEKLILGFYKSTEDFGYYSSAYRFIIILHAMVGIYYVAIFPILSRYYSQSLESFKRLTLYSAKFLFILSIPISFGGFILSKDLIVFIYGYKYIQSTASLQILIWSIIFIYISSILAQGLLAAGREMRIVMAYIIQLLITGALSFVFIPRLGTRAAATAVLLGEVAIFFFYYYEFNKIIKISLMKFFIKPLFAALVMAIVLRIYAGRNPILSLLIGIATYFLSLIVIKGFPWGEIDLILNAVINDKSKLPV